MYNKRYIASIFLEADSPLKIGSGKKDILQDSPILRDFNDLPMILGTSIAGVLRRHYKEYYQHDDLFGYQNRDKGMGSRVVISNAHLVDENGKVLEYLALQKSDFLERFENLPIRNHAKITDKGVVQNHEKFDEEVVFTGSRFKFEIELIGDENDKQRWEKLLTLLSQPTFRFGGGSTKGFGKLKFVSIKEDVLDVTSKEYREKSSSLNTQFGREFATTKIDSKTTTYKLSIKPDDFFIFGGGLGDEDADMTPVLEECIVWEENHKARFTDKQILIPASSIKGALSHRVAYYYNKHNEIYADKIEKEEFKKHTGENNQAVKDIFGHKKELSKDGEELGKKGKIILTDLYKSQKEENKKVFDHVKIDRFTGCAMDGALFQEKTISQDDSWNIEIVTESLEQNSIKALEDALKDIAKGMLPLGGSVNRGHGVFTGSLAKEEEVLYA